MIRPLSRGCSRSVQHPGRQCGVTALQNLSDEAHQAYADEDLLLKRHTRPMEGMQNIEVQPISCTAVRKRAVAIGITTL